MSAPSSPPYRRLKLVISENPASLQEGVGKQEMSRNSSPERPSYSPVTPTLSPSLVPERITDPLPIPINLDENPDAIALQATLSLLQMQRQQSIRDIKGLNNIKKGALEEPEAFVAELKSGKLSKAEPSIHGISIDVDTDDSDAEHGPNTHNDSKFGKLPLAQNIARCPPIEWSKYHVAGERLDGLHELQQRYPGATEEDLTHGIQLQPSEIAAPYRPFTDKLSKMFSSNDIRRYEK